LGVRSSDADDRPVEPKHAKPDYPARTTRQLGRSPRETRPRAAYTHRQQRALASRRAATQAPRASAPRARQQRPVCGVCPPTCARPATSPRPRAKRPTTRARSPRPRRSDRRHRTRGQRHETSARRMSSRVVMELSQRVAGVVNTREEAHTSNTVDCRPIANWQPGCYRSDVRSSCGLRSALAPSPSAFSRETHDRGEQQDMAHRRGEQAPVQHAQTGLVEPAHDEDERAAARERQRCNRRPDSDGGAGESAASARRPFGEEPSWRQKPHAGRRPCVDAPYERTRPRRGPTR